MSARPDIAVDIPGAPGFGNIFRLAWPMTLKAVFLHGTVVIDGWLVAPLGETSLAAMGVAAALGGIILGIIFAFSHAMQIRTAQAFGSGGLVYRKSVLAAGLSIGLVIGLVGVVVILVLGKPLLGSIAPTEAVSRQAWSYLSVFTLVILGESIGQTIASYFNGCGRTKIPLIGYCLSVPVNVISSYALIHGLWGLPAFGVVGAAIGSAIGISLQTLYLVSQLSRNDGHLRRVSGWQRDRFAPTLRRHAVFALPIAATFISATLAGHVCTLIYARMALPSFAAMTLIAPWIMVTGQISMQWTQATGILVAQLLGKQATQSTLDQFLSRAWRGAFVAAGVVAGLMLVLTMSVDVLYPALLPETRAVLVGFLPILLVLQFPRATNAICGNTLRASGDTVYVMKLFLWSQWAFRVPLTAICVLQFDLAAVWILALLLAEEVVKFWPFHSRLWRGEWKRASVLE